MRFKLIALLLLMMIMMMIISVFVVNKTDVMLVIIIILLRHIDLRSGVDAVGVEAHDEAVDVAVSVPGDMDRIPQKSLLKSL